MRTNTFIKALAFAMLLVTACNKNEIANDENTEKKGFALPVTVNVTREGDDATKATYNESTRKLEFSAGDKLFVKSKGSHADAGKFAGTLDYDAVSGKFSGTLTTQKEYTGSIDGLMASAVASLLPAGYGSYGFFSIEGSGYAATVTSEYTKAFALTKAAAVEQFSVEYTLSYSSGFALAPMNAILNFTITGLAASTQVAVVFTSNNGTVNENVTTDALGNATFALGVSGGEGLHNCSLSVGGNSITLVSSEKTLTAGKIYNITRAAAPADPYASLTAEDVGKVIGANGNVYANATAASAAGTTAVAVIAYVGSAGSVDASSATYKGLAIAMSNAVASSAKWSTQSSVCLNSQAADITAAIGDLNGITNTSTLIAAGHSSHGHGAATAAASNNGTAAPTGTSGWFLPSLGQWNLIVQGLASKKAGTAVTTDLTESENDTYKAANLSSVITAAGGNELNSDSQWSSTETDNGNAWRIRFNIGNAVSYTKTGNIRTRSVLAF